MKASATAHWLLNEERVGDWKAEIVRRKGPKTRNGRLQEAVRLLAQVGLQPSAL